MLRTLLAGAAAALIATAAAAADFKPAVIFDMGGKFDKSFNEGVWNGVKKFMDETGVDVMEFEVTNETQREQAMRKHGAAGARLWCWESASRRRTRLTRSRPTIPDRGFRDHRRERGSTSPNLRQYAFKEA